MIARSGTVVGMVALLLFASTSPALADANEEARAYLERAKSAFALSHYAQAAEYFEKAFELKADRALLFNAAQSHRLAGNKERALALYQNYLRVYGNDEKAAQIEKQIEELKRAIERDRKEMPVPPPPGWPGGVPPGKGPSPVTPAPATSTAAPEPTRPPPAAAGPAPVEPLASHAGSPPPPAAPNPTDSQPRGDAASVLTKSASPGETEETPLTRKAWFWVAVGGAAAAAIVTVLVIALSKTNDPSPSFGTAHGN